MKIHVDTSVLVSIADAGPELDRFAALTVEYEQCTFSSLVLFEWLRGPRTRVQLDRIEALIPPAGLVVFGQGEADMAATLYKRLRRPRGREIDLCIAACAIAHSAALWTLNKRDFADIPALELL